MPSTDPETCSWCPFAGRSNTPEYAECYNANEEHTPRIFTVQGLCQHVFTQHTDKYREFTQNIKHHIELNRCDTDGVRIVPGTAAPLDTAHIQSELREFEIEKLTEDVPLSEIPQGAGSVICALWDRWDERDKRNERVRQGMETAGLADDHDYLIINYMHELLSNTPIWVGTLQDLHSQIFAVAPDTSIQTQHKLIKRITRIKPLLKNAGIRFFIPPYIEFSASVAILQKEENGKFRPITELHEVIKAKIAGTWTEPADAETAPETETKTDAIITHEDNYCMDCIHHVLEVTPTWAGTPEDLYAAIHNAALNMSDRGDEFTFIETPHDLGENLIRIKPRFEQNHIRFFKVPYEDFNKLILVLQREVDGEFEPVSRKSVAKLLATIPDIPTPPEPPEPPKETPRTTNQTSLQRIHLITERIQQLLADTPMITGSPAELHSKISYTVDGELFPKSVSVMGWLLNRSKERLLQMGIRFSRIHVAQPKTKTGQLLVLQKKVNGEFKSNSVLRDEIVLPTSMDTTTGNRVCTGVEALPQTVRDMIENEFREGATLTQILHKIKKQTNPVGITEYKIKKYMQWCNTPRPPTIRTAITELPARIRNSIEKDFREGVPKEAIQRRINDLTKGEFRITDHVIRRYMKRWDIPEPPYIQTVAWNPHTAKYVDWGDIVVDRIRLLLRHSPAWTGTATKLQSTIRCEVNREWFPRTPNAVTPILKRVTQRLLKHDIRYKLSNRPSRGRIQIWRIPDAETEPDEETCRAPIDTAPPETVCETTDELPEPTPNTLPEPTPTTTEHSIEVIGVTTIEQSKIKIPADVLSRIGVQEGGRIIYLDDGKNIIIKPAKYTDQKGY